MIDIKSMTPNEYNRFKKEASAPIGDFLPGRVHTDCFAFRRMTTDMHRVPCMACHTLYCGYDNGCGFYKSFEQLRKEREEPEHEPISAAAQADSTTVFSPLMTNLRR